MPSRFIFVQIIYIRIELVYCFVDVCRFYKSEEKFVEMSERIRLGDIIGVRGSPCRTKAGELSIRPEEIIILTPCLHQMPQ